MITNECKDDDDSVNVSLFKNIYIKNQGIENMKIYIYKRTQCWLKIHCSIPCSFDITRGRYLVVTQCTADVRLI